MGMGFAPTWLRQVSPLLHKTTLTTAAKAADCAQFIKLVPSRNGKTSWIWAGSRSATNRTICCPWDVPPLGKISQEFVDNFLSYRQNSLTCFRSTAVKIHSKNSEFLRQTQMTFKI